MIFGEQPELNKNLLTFRLFPILCASHYSSLAGPTKRRGVVLKFPQFIRSHKKLNFPQKAQKSQKKKSLKNTRPIRASDRPVKKIHKITHDTIQVTYKINKNKNNTKSND